MFGKVSLTSYERICKSNLFTIDAKRMFDLLSNEQFYMYELSNKDQILCIAFILEFHDERIVVFLNSIQPRYAKKMMYHLAHIQTYTKKTIVYVGDELNDKCKKYLSKIHFEFDHSATSYIFTPASSLNLSFWKEFYHKRGHKIINYLVNHGFDRCSFYEAENDDRFKKYNLVAKLKTQIGQGFSKEFNPFDDNQYDPKLSYIAYYNEEPVAFLCVRVINDYLLLRMLSVHHDYQNSGAMLLPVSKFVRKVISLYEEDPNMYEGIISLDIKDDTTTHHLLESTLNNIIFKRNHRFVYIYNNEENKQINI